MKFKLALRIEKKPKAVSVVPEYDIPNCDGLSLMAIQIRQNIGLVSIT